MKIENHIYLIEQIVENKITEETITNFLSLSSQEQKKVWTDFLERNIENKNNKLINTVPIQNFIQGIEFFKHNKINRFFDINFVYKQIFNTELPKEKEKLKAVEDLLFSIANKRSWDDTTLLMLIRKTTQKSIFKESVIELIKNKRTWDKIFKLTLKDKVKPFFIEEMLTEYPIEDLKEGLPWINHLSEDEKRKLLYQICLYSKAVKKIEIILHNMKDLWAENSIELSKLMIDLLNRSSIEKLELFDNEYGYEKLFNEISLYPEDFVKKIPEVLQVKINSFEEYKWINTKNSPNVINNHMIETLLMNLINAIPKSKENISSENKAEIKLIESKLNDLFQNDKINPGLFDKEIFAKVLYASVTQQKTDIARNIYNHISENSSLSVWLANEVVHPTKDIKRKIYGKKEEIKVTNGLFHNTMVKIEKEELMKKLSSSLENKPKAKKSKI